MPHQCHGHSHGETQAEKADLFTNANSIIGGTTSFLSMLFFVARLVDTFGDYEKKFAEMSYPGMAIGLTMALYAAIGSTICHRALNKQNQDQTHDRQNESDHSPTSSVSLNSQAISTDERRDEEKPILQAISHVKTTQLTNWQRLWLLADFVGHSSDVASPILFILLYAFEMQKYQKALVYTGSLMVGLFSSVASVRTCQNALLKENKNEKPSDHHRYDGHGHSHR